MMMMMGGAGCRACSGDDENAKVFPELLEEDEGEDCVRNQSDTGGDQTLQHNHSALGDVWQCMRLSSTLNSKTIFNITLFLYHHV